MLNTKIALSLDVRTKICALLNGTLANVSDLYSQTKQAHWNVRGSLFISLHKLFDELASGLEEHIDTVAERITTLGGLAQGTVRQAAANSKLPEFPEKQSDDLSFVSALIDRFAIVGNSVREAIDNSSSLGDADTADLLTGLSRDLDKSLWFLEAHNLD